MTSALEIKAAKIALEMSGQVGMVAVINTTEAVAPVGFYFCAMQVITDTVVTSQTAVTGFNVPALSTLTTIPAGLYPTKLTKIKLTSGKVLMYLAQL